MDIRQLKYFVAVAEEQNFGSAARKLNVSQPPITRQIQKLEAEIGVKLLRRTSKGTDVTEAGRILLHDALEILARIERAMERTRCAQRGELGVIEIGYFGSVSYSTVPRILRMFKSQNPEVELSLHRLSKAEQIAALKQGQLHVGFGRYYPVEPELQIEEVVSEGIALCVPESYPMSIDDTNWTQVFQKLPLVLFPAAGRPNFADETISLLKREGVSPSIAAVAEDGRAALMQVAIGAGACVVPSSMLGMNWFGVKMALPKALAGDCPTSIIYRKSDTSALLRKFVSTMRAIRAGDDHGILK